MNSLIKEVSKGMSERLSDPLLGSFTISFLFWNWKFFFTLFFSSGTASGRMHLALLEFHCISGFLVPIGFAALYVLWRSFVPKALDIFKDLCEKILDKWDLRNVTNQLELKNEISNLKGLIKCHYKITYTIPENQIEIIKRSEMNFDVFNNLHNGLNYYGYKDLKGNFNVISKYNNESIDFFFFTIDKYSDNYLSVYKSHNGLLNKIKKLHAQEMLDTNQDVKKALESKIEFNIKENAYEWK